MPLYLSLASCSFGCIRTSELILSYQYAPIEVRRMSTLDSSEMQGQLQIFQQ